ncbi:MAG: ABC transporter permease [Bacillota bacterium]|nr:ABC transporter permease [Bacillota bacterium]HHU30268.1 ABC transporter permease [Bacillota bacterium]
MTRYVIIRIFQALIALIGITILVFILVRLSGDPMDLIRTPTSTEEEIARLKEYFGLDKSYPEQLWIYLNSLFRGDFGTSIIKRQPVIDMIKAALPNTIKMGLPSFIIAMSLALVLGVLAATKRDSLLDNGVKLLAVLGQALPGFWVAVMLVLLLSVKFRLLPVAGMGTLKHYVLPVGTMVFFMLPGMMRLVRSSMLDVLDSEYIKLARIKGLPDRKIIWKHALRNAFIAPLTSAGMLFASLITGAVITEIIFNWPGMGRLAVEAVQARDFPVVQAITIIVASMVLGMNILVDITYAIVDPQIRFQKS